MVIGSMVQGARSGAGEIRSARPAGATGWKIVRRASGRQKKRRIVGPVGPVGQVRQTPPREILSNRNYNSRRGEYGEAYVTPKRKASEKSTNAPAEGGKGEAAQMPPREILLN